MPPLWTVEFSQKAATDFDNIIHNTLHKFGALQATRYSQLIAKSLQELSVSGPHHPLVKNRPELFQGIQSMHIQRKGYKARHILFFKTITKAHSRKIIILRLLHESMEFGAHL